MTTIKTEQLPIEIPYSEIRPGQFFRRKNSNRIYKMIEVYFVDIESNIDSSKRVSVGINEDGGGTYVLSDTEMVFPIGSLRVTFSS